MNRWIHSPIKRTNNLYYMRLIKKKYEKQDDKTEKCKDDKDKDKHLKTNF